MASEQSAEQIGLAASGAAFWLVIAIFPATLAAVSIFGLVVSPHQVEAYVVARGRALLASLVAVLALGVLALGSTAVSVVLAYLPGILVKVAAVPVLVVVLAALAAGLYRFSIARPMPLSRLAPGSVGTAVGLIALAGGFGVYLKVSTHYTAVYGALAGAVITMIASYLAVYALLIGAVLNAQLDQLRGRPLPGPRAPRAALG